MRVCSPSIRMSPGNFPSQGIAGERSPHHSHQGDQHAHEDEDPCRVLDDHFCFGLFAALAFVAVCCSFLRSCINFVAGFRGVFRSLLAIVPWLFRAILRKLRSLVANALDDRLRRILVEPVINSRLLA